MAERIQKLIADQGARVQEIDVRRKELASEIRQREEEDAGLVLERDRSVFAIKTLEMALDEKDLEKSWTAQQRYRKQDDPFALPMLIHQVLEKHPDGLQVPAIYTEVRKLGFQTDAKNPLNLLSSTLHARTADLFTRRKIARGVLWLLKKYDYQLPADSTSTRLEGAVPAETRAASRFEKIALKSVEDFNPFAKGTTR
jgi:hypothetical protein